jgi:hypothetical protein
MTDKPDSTQRDTYKNLFIKNSSSPNGKYTQTKMNEDDYLQTSVWRELRERRLQMDGRCCVFCKSTEGTEVHHRRYPAVWGMEDVVRDLVTVCRMHHKELHGHD